MLVLTRRQEESFEIDGGITIHVLRTENGRVKIGIDAPREIGIWRSELDRNRSVTHQSTHTERRPA